MTFKNWKTFSSDSDIPFDLEFFIRKTEVSEDFLNDLRDGRLNVDCPLIVKTMVIDLLKKYENEGKIHKVQESIDTLEIQRLAKFKFEIDVEIHVIDQYQETLEE